MDPYIKHVMSTTTDLINSSPEISGTEQLPDLEALRDFIDRHVVTEVNEPTIADLHGLRDLRRRLHSVFLAPDEVTALERVNYLLAATPIKPRLTEHNGLGLHLHYFSPYAPIADHIAADNAMGFALVIAAGEHERLRTCAAPTCERVFVDESRNRSRLYCDGQSCGNRLHTAAYRARQRHKTTTTS